MTQKHTPGPYWYNFDNVNNRYRVNGADGYGSIASVLSEANAQMIVTALNAIEEGNSNV